MSIALVAEKELRPIVLVPSPTYNTSPLAAPITSREKKEKSGGTIAGIQETIRESERASSGALALGRSGGEESIFIFLPLAIVYRYFQEQL